MRRRIPGGAFFPRVLCRSKLALRCRRSGSSASDSAAAPVARSRTSTDSCWPWPESAAHRRIPPIPALARAAPAPRQPLARSGCPRSAPISARRRTLICRTLASRAAAGTSPGTTAVAAPTAGTAAFARRPAVRALPPERRVQFFASCSFAQRASARSRPPATHNRWAGSDAWKFLLRDWKRALPAGAHTAPRFEIRVQPIGESRRPASRDYARSAAARSAPEPLPK